MAGRQNRQESLVNRPGPHLRQEGLLVGPGDPIGAICASSDFRRIIGLFVAMIVIGQFSWKTPESFAEISPAMNKNDGRIGARREESAIGRRQAAEHSVRRCHCGQSDMDAARPAICQKTMREGHCGLGLSGASHILDDEEYWPVRERDLFTEELQRCWLVDVGKQRFHTPKGSRLCRNEAGLPLGGSAIILSATLPGLKRHALIDAFRKGLGSEEPWNSISAYPLVTIAAAESVDEYQTCLRESLAREVAVRRIGDLTEAHAAVFEAACKGAAVALIRNTVDEAVASHAELASAFDGETLLFHARFAMADRLAIEERVLEKFGRAPKIARPGILVATQVIEQSLDLDFDLIVTDLAPIDLLIQRAGRLWRHMDQRPGSARPRCQWRRQIVPNSGVKVYRSG
jgi:hypothetical protein